MGMTMMDYLEFYPDLVECFSNICDTALEKAGFTFDEIEEVNTRMSDELEHCFKEQIGNRRPVDILIGVIGDETVYALGERFPKEKFEFENDGIASCLYVNGEKYIEGDILPLFENEYPEIDFDSSNVELSNASLTKLPGGAVVTFDVKFDADTLETILRRVDFDEEFIQNAVNDVDNANVAMVLARRKDRIDLDVATNECNGGDSYRYFRSVPLFSNEKEALMNITQDDYKREIAKGRTVVDRSDR